VSRDHKKVGMVLNIAMFSVFNFKLNYFCFCKIQHILQIDGILPISVALIVFGNASNISICPRAPITLSILINIFIVHKF